MAGDAVAEGAVEHLLAAKSVLAAFQCAVRGREQGKTLGVADDRLGEPRHADIGAVRHLAGDAPHQRRARIGHAVGIAGAVRFAVMCFLGIDGGDVAGAGIASCAAHAEGLAPLDDAADREGVVHVRRVAVGAERGRQAVEPLETRGGEEPRAFAPGERCFGERVGLGDRVHVPIVGAKAGRKS